LASGSSSGANHNAWCGVAWRGGNANGVIVSWNFYNMIYITSTFAGIYYMEGWGIYFLQPLQYSVTKTQNYSRN